MTPIRVYFRDNEILIDTIPTALVAGSLTASASPDGSSVLITRVDSDFVLASIPWPSVAAQDGSTFTSLVAALAYLASQFAMRRPVGETFGIATVAGADLVQGMPIAVSRSTGQLLPARGDTYALSFVAGLASLGTVSGFAVQPSHGAIALADWTAVAKQVALLPGQPYFLGATGGLTTIPPASPGLYVTRVGVAASPTTLIVAPTDPITL